MSINIHAQVPGCDCGVTKGTKHPRQEIKDRPIPSSINSSSNTSVNDMIGWTVPENPKIKGSQKDAKEKSLYSVSGYLQNIKIGPDDCDLEIELSANKDKSSDRIIAEIPNTKEYCILREKLLKDLKDKYSFNLNKGSNTLNNAPEIKLTGYSFWDSQFYSDKAAAREKGKGHGSKYVKSLWEIHPVVNIEVE